LGLVKGIEARLTTMLTIAGLDPSSGAGVTADLMVFAAFGCFGTSCVTALTVQSTRGVRSSEAIAPHLVSATLDCLDEDLPAGGVKIGMLATAENVLAVCEFLKRLRARPNHVPVVLDPVLRSSSGRELLSAAGIQALCERLLPLVDWVTPNVAELGELTGETLDTREDVEVAAHALVARCRTFGVVAKGGHLEDCADDLVVEAGGRSTWLPGERLVSRSTHGTGCAFSSALVCGLAHGVEAVEAARAAKAFVRGAIERSTPIGTGSGPMNLLWPLRK
jgi:hydroxymethylpyrimidine/phosphomethylpyrimidine kinase